MTCVHGHTRRTATLADGEPVGTHARAIEIRSSDSGGCAIKRPVDVLRVNSHASGTVSARMGDGEKALVDVASVKARTSNCLGERIGPINVGASTGWNQTNRDYREARQQEEHPRSPAGRSATASHGRSLLSRAEREHPQRLRAWLSALNVDRI